jgi:hypothetical protein
MREFLKISKKSRKPLNKKPWKILIVAGKARELYR